MSILMENKIKNHIEKNIKHIVNKMIKDYNLTLINPVLSESLKEFSLRKGKRIRPLLFILSYKGYKNADKKISDSIYHVSTSLEFLHNFMLIHDDIIDNSPLRRGKPTMHRLLSKTISAPEKKEMGNNLGIIAGDILYAVAINTFLGVKEDPIRKEKALKYFIETTAITAIGEFIDTIQGVESLTAIKEKDVFLTYSLKTARYTFNCPLVLGAILAGADNKEIKILSDLSLLIGQAFQIQDDIIGLFDSQKQIGKSNISDLDESKKTLLICHAYEKLKSKDQKKFIKLFNKSKKSNKDLLQMRKILLDAQSLHYCLEQIKIRFDKTFELISKTHIRNPYKQIISDNLIRLFKHSDRIAKKYEIDLRIIPDYTNSNK